MNTHTGLYVLSKIMKNFIGVMSEEARTISDTDGELCYTYRCMHTRTHTHIHCMCCTCVVHVKCMCSLSFIIGLYWQVEGWQECLHDFSVDF